MDPIHLSLAYTGAVMAVAGALDAVYREVDPELWMAALPLGLGLGLASVAGGSPVAGPWFLPILLGLVVVALLGALYIVGMMGGADLFAGLLIALSAPVAPGSILPPVMLAILYQAPVIAGYMAWKYASLCGAGCLVPGRARVRGRRLVTELSWWAPRGYRLEADVHEVVAIEGLWDREVQVTPLMPWVAFLAVGYYASLLLGDLPLRLLIQG